MNRLKSIRFDSQETTSALNYFSKHLSSPLLSEKHNLIEKTGSTFSPGSIKCLLDQIHKAETYELIKSIQPQIKIITDIVANQKSIESEYKHLLTQIKSNDDIINEVLEKYNQYLSSNKSLLIRNEILQTFINKINITKEDKDNLLNQNLYDAIFFKLIHKMIEIKNEIKIIERNSETFSKTLLFSIKENYNIIDELLNEKIVIYLKQTFRNNVSKLEPFCKQDYNNILMTITYLKEKENYLNFVLKEYTGMKKKNLEEFMRNKYNKINSFEQVFISLVEDYEIYFLMEFITLFTFFNDCTDSFTQADMDILMTIFNFPRLRLEKFELSQIEEMLIKIKTVKSKKDFYYYINYLNQILYIFEELFYETINSIKNTKIESSLSEMYKVTILDYYQYSKIENILKRNNFALNLLNENLNLFSMLSNYKKTFSKTLTKVSTEIQRNIQKIQNSFINTLKEDQSSSFEQTIFKYLVNTASDFAKCLSMYSEYQEYFSVEDKENLNPRNYNSFKSMLSIFQSESLLNESHDFHVLLKLLNLIQNLISKLSEEKVAEIIHEDLCRLKDTYAKTELLIVKQLSDNILKATKFEEKLIRNISHEQTISLIEFIMEKSQFYFLNLSLLSDFSSREGLKDKVKSEILKVYKEILAKEENLNLSFFSEEEFRNYLDIL